ncbi:MAG: hypothetical protein WDN69_12910 [Aliidongia sp.]
MTYPGFKAAAQLRQLRLEGIAVDQEGLLPDAFAAACRATPVRLLYCSPNLCNPLAGVLSLERRRAIVEIARQHDVLIVEDDCLRLPDRPAALAGRIGAGTHAARHLAVQELRAGPAGFGFILAPADRLDRLMLAVRASVWMAAAADGRAGDALDPLGRRGAAGPGKAPGGDAPAGVGAGGAGQCLRRAGLVLSFLAAPAGKLAGWRVRRRSAAPRRVGLTRLGLFG